MRAKSNARDPSIGYSMAFKMEVVRELEQSGASFAQMRRKYGIKGDGTIEGWVRRYGNGTRGQRIIVQKPEEIDELQQLKERNRRLESALADAHVDLALERSYLRLACQRAGIEDIEAFKKKAAGKQPIKP